MTWRIGALATLSVAVLGAYAVWLLSHPVSLPSDDALFFVRAVDRFSVVELSPHFPGYPGFVIAARAVDWVVQDAARSVFSVAALAGLSIPIAIYFWVLGSGAEVGFAWAAAACALFHPSLPGVSLSMLSDPLGIALALWCLVALQADRFAWSGILMGLCLAARPSYAVLLLATLVCLIALRRSALWSFTLGFASIGTAAGLFVLAADGIGYFEEGRRFIAGHFQIWGLGSEPRTGSDWIESLRELVGGTLGALAGIAALAWSTRGLEPRNLATAVSLTMLITHAAWILGAQNLDSSRHSVPLVFLAIGITGVGLARARPHLASSVLLGLLLVSTLHGFVSAVDRARAATPLERASRVLEERSGALLITQRGVEVLRARHPQLRIFDGFYGPSARLAAHASRDRPVLRLSASPLPPPWVVMTVLPARFPGEKSLVLYESRAGTGVTGLEGQGEGS